MKRILMAIVAVLTLTTTNITIAEDVYYWKDPVLTTTGEDTFRVYKAQVNTEEDRRLLEEDKQKLRKIITYYKKIDAVIKEKNKNPSSALQYYNDMFKKFKDVFNTSTSKNRYDKEYVGLVREIAQITTNYYLSVYKELGTEQSKELLESTSRILDDTAILRFVTDNPNYYK
jgi:hypothetical protein